MRRPSLSACALSVLLTTGSALAVVPLSAAPAAAATSTSVRLAGPASTELGAPYRLSVLVTPARPGTAVQLQRQVGGVWRASANARLGSNSRASFTVPAPAKGTFVFRAVRSAEHGYAGAVSGTVKVTVRAKERLLAALPPSGSAAGFSSSDHRNVSATVRGVTLTSSLVDRGNDGYYPSVLTYALDGTFSSLRATLGLDDTSPSGSLGSLEVLGDGRLLGSYQLVPGTPVPVRLPLAGVHQLQLRSHHETLSQSAVVVGHPVVSTDTTSGTAGDLTTFLADLRPTQGSGERADWVQDGRLLGDTVDVGYIPGQQDEWNLAGKYTRLVGGIGLHDGGNDDATTGSVSIFADGKEVQTVTAEEGYTPVDLDLTGVVFLRIVINESADYGMDTYLVHPVLVG